MIVGATIVTLLVSAGYAFWCMGALHSLLSGGWFSKKYARRIMKRAIRAMGIFLIVMGLVTTSVAGMDSATPILIILGALMVKWPLILGMDLSDWMADYAPKVNFEKSPRPVDLTKIREVERWLEQ